MKQSKLLIVDDLPEVKDFLLDALKPSYHVRGVTTGTEALDILREERFDMLITDIAMPDMSGEELVSKVNEMGLDLMIIAVTAYGSIENATKLMRLGAYDYIEKPFKIERLKHTIEKAFEIIELKRENRSLYTQLEEHERMKSLVGNSVVLQRIREKIRLVAPTKATILITGESGTGKELVAREIHNLSDRRNGPFVTINCASIPETLLESQLFGHEKGAFTGAIRSVPGKFELANGGTILLDEIGEMSATIQAKLLRVLQESEFDRVGGTKPVKVDARVIATTNRNLREEIQKGNFREDLYYRLHVVPIEMPPLRERREDIPLLINHFIEICSVMHGREAIKLTPAAMRKLSEGYWKGNVRELENCIERAVITAGGATLDADAFQLENEKEEQLSKMEHTYRYGTIREMEKIMILGRLRELSENRTKAAKSLDISVRTLRNKLHEYNIPRKSRMADQTFSSLLG